jgi:hypothetical protein
MARTISRAFKKAVRDQADNRAGISAGGTIAG